MALSPDFIAAFGIFIANYKNPSSYLPFWSSVEPPNFSEIELFYQFFTQNPQDFTEGTIIDALNAKALIHAKTDPHLLTCWSACFIEYNGIKNFYPTMGGMPSHPTEKGLLDTELKRTLSHAVTSQHVIEAQVKRIEELSGKILTLEEEIEALKAQLAALNSLPQHIKAAQQQLVTLTGLLSTMSTTINPPAAPSHNMGDEPMSKPQITPPPPPKIKPTPVKPISTSTQGTTASTSDVQKPKPLSSTPNNFYQQLQKAVTDRQQKGTPVPPPRNQTPVGPSEIMALYKALDARKRANQDSPEESSVAHEFN